MIVFNQLPDSLAGMEDVLSEWLLEVGRKHDTRVKGLSYSFLDNESIEEMNAKHLDHHYPTDIITFGYKEGKRVSGEIFIGYETVLENAREYGVADVEELCRVVAHGLLHLIGFDDHTDAEKAIMRKEEEKCLILRPKKLKSNTL